MDQQMQEAIKRLKTMGGEQVAIDFAPFAETAILLYGAAFVAERYSGESDYHRMGLSSSSGVAEG